jgi:diaminopimelate epimerase
MTFTVTKMHGLGNDFVMLRPEALPSLAPTFLKQLAIHLCNRHFGFGADGLIIPVPSDLPTYDFKFVYYNNDGSIAEMCGNGIRCFARYIADEGLSDKTSLRIETLAGIIETERQSDGLIKVNMGAPRLVPAEVPFNVDQAEALSGLNAGAYSLKVESLQTKVTLWPVSMGNPHAIVFQADQVQAFDPAVFGPLLELHPAFPEFVEQLGEAHFKVVVWERGCGFTLACGTGACATVVAARLAKKLTQDKATIDLPGGQLHIEWHGEADAPVWMTGPASTVYTAQPSKEQALAWGLA